ncbi:aspartyl-phosphate phosphatase Spo0E family protein [Lederbergia citrea]|uniref:Aspartyl-phosphate phosphatase Spo0E family protein n=1 Tax=Lederbergia citrea TaxID=2833581 RepID=A0A942ULG3_9BACI|nr:aspartyl-phosphate phosphatase Spo0E family protein [Lederbergia citrea]MBS4177321.1 aspartyl-phosphate phosphatase Spo0E family protein [Lederbergia citrea]MBS4203984.1 aspartyl-phosphate phosphatase Spo0E family protein [Lederbergia citrea]MBS4221432.1 aspartyl-phosphate phosphatase Spo0E family protein [Lederbergia citrea]
MHCRGKEQIRFLLRIQEKRDEMCLHGEKHGLCAAITIACSRELDSLLNEYYQLFQAEKYTKTPSRVPRKAGINFYIKQQRLSSAK